ncbi:MAG: MarR family transcriptional regulator [Erysipelotrichaceae bacterium]|nr:MarR family transcriptional regulator [Erysipelotrichaceae bacterium]MDP3305589.1 MarR family transcriptional regulator [Erysipelotrichaceae bacterium]
MSYDQLKLKSQLCFPLYAASRKIIRLYKPLLDPLGITYTQYLVLLVLWEQDEQYVNDIGEKLILDSGTLTPLLKKLQTAGLIERKRSKTDERNVLISLTQKGKELEEKTKGVPAQIGVCLTLPKEKLGQLYNLLYDFIDMDIVVNNDEEKEG